MKRYKNIKLDYGVNTEYMESFNNKPEEEFEEEYVSEVEAPVAAVVEEEAVISEIIEVE